MSNTGDLFRAYRNYWSARVMADADYETAYLKIKKYEGSKEFDRQLKEIKAAKDSRYKAARTSWGQASAAIIERMKKAAANYRNPVPNDEQLRVIQLFKLRNELTTEDFRDVEHMFVNCPVAARSLDEIAREKQIPFAVKNTDGSFVGRDDVLSALKGMESVCSELGGSTEVGGNLWSGHKVAHFDRKENESDFIFFMLPYGVPLEGFSKIVNE